MKFQKFYPSCDGKLTLIYLPLARLYLEQKMAETNQTQQRNERILSLNDVGVIDLIHLRHL